MGCRCHRRKSRGTHHIDLPGARQQPRGGIPGNRKRKAGRCFARPGGRSNACRSRCSIDRASALVYGSRCGASRSGLMSIQTLPTDDISPLSPAMPATLSPDLLEKMDAYWRAANYLSIGQIYLKDNPLLETPLRLEHVKPRL